jgi:hypothetical protein
VPLRAQIDGNDINAFDYDSAAWTVLKATYKTSNLQMPCCQNSAIPKTNKLGNLFFAHARRGECAFAAESAEHIYLKTLVAKAAQACGWLVVTEAQGNAPDGTKWVADVLCTKGKNIVALEVQLSYQTKSALATRQESYRKAGVRAAWFAGHKRYKTDYVSASRELPFFYLLPFGASEEPKVVGLGLSLSACVIALLSKRIAWKETPRISYMYGVRYLVDVCWKCNGEINQVLGWFVDVYNHIGKTIPNMSSVLESISASIGNLELAKKGLNTIGKFAHMKGNAPGFPYCNVCIHCGAPQSNYHVMQRQSSKGRGYVEFPKFDGSSSGSWVYMEN